MNGVMSGVMNSNILDILRIGIFYDGYYFYKVSNYYKYEHEKKSRISISGLHEFIRNEVSVLTKMDMRQCQIIDAHYFKGRSSAKDLGEKVQAERVFEDILMRENIVSHYLPLRYGENNIAQEKGIDVWLALEAYELAIYKHFDVLVLVAGDGDYVPLVRKLHTLGTQVILISWDFSYHNENGDMVETKTSRQLQEEVFYAVQMYQRIEQNGSDYIRELFVPDRGDRAPVQGLGEVRNAHLVPPAAVPGAGGGKAPAASPSPVVETPAPPAEPREAPAVPGSAPGLDPDQEFTSTIMSINQKGFGFIRDGERNNIFFHYSCLTNRDFEELAPGMRVRYTVEEDEERSKREDMLIFRARKVTVIDDEEEAV